MSTTSCIDPRGQWISPIKKGDDQAYHCMNRADEDPFSKRKSGNNSIIEKSWLQFVNSKCEDNWFRRCLGDNPDMCVYINGGNNCGNIGGNVSFFYAKNHHKQFFIGSISFSILWLGIWDHIIS